MKCDGKVGGRGDGELGVVEQLTASEMENVTTVFRYFETGLREATILSKVGHLIVNTCSTCRCHQCNVYREIQITSANKIKHNMKDITATPAMEFRINLHRLQCLHTSIFN